MGCLYLLVFHHSIAQKSHDEYNQKERNSYSLGVEYVNGFNTTMEAYSLRLGYGSMLSNKIGIYGLIDLTTTKGFRELLMEGNTNRLDAESFGLGTSFLLRWYPIRLGSVRLFIDLAAGVLYSFKSFPPNGTRLNFTARPGAGLAIHLNSKTQLELGINRFHLSNGQGYNHPINPTFNGLGLSAMVILR